jgi:threonine dehydrogenase-like Zn-dependent dehydrogenase
MSQVQDQLSIVFTAPHTCEVEAHQLPKPVTGQVQVHTLLSAISPGSELLVYRGLAPHDLPVDDTIEALSGGFSFPIRYGYALVGEVTALGPGVDPSLEGQQVFAFHPHESRFNAQPKDLIPLPPGISIEDAVFLPSMETALNFVLDGHPLIGEQVVVVGQGIVGLLTTALLARFPLVQLVSLDHFTLRREASLAMGAQHSLDAGGSGLLEQLREILGAVHRYDGADLVYELSGSPEALNLAIAVGGFASRIVIGSWYGQKQARLDLGGRFHRARQQLVSSQVSSLSPSLIGRWTKPRRLEAAWQGLLAIRPSRLITHRFPLAEASEAYQLLDHAPQSTIQVVFTQ